MKSVNVVPSMEIQRRPELLQSGDNSPSNHNRTFEFGKNYAATKIEVAALAIRSSPRISPERQSNETDVDKVIDGDKRQRPRKTVTFNNIPLVHEIDPIEPEAEEEETTKVSDDDVQESSDVKETEYNIVDPSLSKRITSRNKRILNDLVLTELTKPTRNTLHQQDCPFNLTAATYSPSSIEIEILQAVVKTKSSLSLSTPHPLVDDDLLPCRKTYDTDDTFVFSVNEKDNMVDSKRKEDLLPQFPRNEFDKPMLSEFERITSVKHASYKERHVPSKLVLVGQKTVLQEPAWRPIVEEKQSHRLSSEATAAVGKLYIKVLAAENLDLPIDEEPPLVRCVLNSDTLEYASDYQTLAHTVYFGQEFCIDVELGSEFTLTLQTTDSSSNGKQPPLARLRRRNSSITRYINDTDGAVAQSRIVFSSISSKCRGQVCTASFALVNGWYQLARQGIVRKQKRNNPEKAIGKITVKLFFLADHDHQSDALPDNFYSCEQAMNIKRYSRTCWQTGYMSQIGGDLNFWRRRYYSLRGWRLFSYTDTFPHLPRTVIDLSKAVMLASSATAEDDDRVIFQKEKTSPMVQDGDPSIIVKNGFRITFDNGDHIHFCCDSAKERTSWIELIKAIVSKVPEWPSWLEPEGDFEQEDDGAESPPHLFLTGREPLLSQQKV